MPTNNEMAVAPSLPPSCIDFNKVHAAAKRGDTPEKAIEDALIVPVGEEPSAQPDTPAEETPDNG